jgi:phosphatidylinositol kinase/protein kinase (PI-3  family)
MALCQVITLLRDANRRAGLDLYLRPYGCLPTGYECGVIEVVPNTKVGSSYAYGRSCGSITPHGMTACLSRLLHEHFHLLNMASTACRAFTKVSCIPIPFTLQSRAALGELNDRGLYDIFTSTFGPPGSAAFEAARHAFIISEAAYAIASYLLQASSG